MTKTDSESESLLFSMLLFLMLLGLLMIEAGCVRSKNAASVFLRGLASLMISLVTSWICGYMFAHSSGHYLIGYDSNFSTLHRVPEGTSSHWVMYSLLSALASSIVASSMTERTHLTGHLILSALCSLIIFPVSAHWIWHPEGWLAVRGCTDLGGIITVHMFGGCGSFVGNLLVGPRVERLGDNFRDVSLPGHSLPLTAVGAMFVIMGMVGKLAGAGDQIESVGRVTVNLLVAGAGGGLVTMTIFKLKGRRRKQYSYGGDGGVKAKVNNVNAPKRMWSFLTAFNGLFTGMISVSGVGADLPSWGAFVTGLVGGLMFFLVSGLLRLNKVDDPTHAIGVHLSGGIVGAIVVGLVNLAETQSGISIGWEIVGLISVSAWSCGCFLVMLLPLLLCGKLRIKDAQERQGIDTAKIKEQAYDFSTPAVKSTVTRTAVPHFTRDNVFLTPNMDRNNTYNVSCQLSAINKMSQLNSSRGSDLDLQGVSPKLILQPPPTGSIHQDNIPAPPPYPTSTMKKTSSLNVPELTITSTCISENDSEAPLLNSLSTSITSNKDTLSLDMREIKKKLRKQKEQLKKTNSVYVSREDLDELNSSIDSDGTINSVKSSVIRQVATVAGNKENFSYLTATNKPEDNTNVTEVNDTDIDITKFLKSPDPQAQNMNKDNNNSISEDKSKKKYEEEKKVFESSIEFVSDGEESDFDEKLI